VPLAFTLMTLELGFVPLPLQGRLNQELGQSAAADCQFTLHTRVPADRAALGKVLYSSRWLRAAH
jgi:hypothetical protein